MGMMKALQGYQTFRAHLAPIQGVARIPFDLDHIIVLYLYLYATTYGVKAVYAFDGPLIRFFVHIKLSVLDWIKLGNFYHLIRSGRKRAI